MFWNENTHSEKRPPKLQGFETSWAVITINMVFDFIQNYTKTLHNNRFTLIFPL